MDTASALEIKARHEATLLALPGVVGVGVGRRGGEPVIAVFTSTGEVPAGLPTDLEGVPISVVDVGELSPL